MIKMRKVYEIKFTAEHYAAIKSIVETMGLKIKQVRGNKFNGNFIGNCRMDFKASEDELSGLFMRLNKYCVETV